MQILFAEAFLHASSMLMLFSTVFAVPFSGSDWFVFGFRFMNIFFHPPWLLSIKCFMLQAQFVISVFFCCSIGFGSRMVVLTNRSFRMLVFHQAKQVSEAKATLAPDSLEINAISCFIKQFLLQLFKGKFNLASQKLLVFPKAHQKKKVFSSLLNPQAV